MDIKKISKIFAIIFIVMVVGGAVLTLGLSLYKWDNSQSTYDALNSDTTVSADTTA